MAHAASARPKPCGQPGVRPLDEDWELASSAPDVCVDPAAAAQLDWSPATVPGTVAGAIGREAFGEAAGGRDPDAEDWWFRTSFEADDAASGEEVVLRLDGLASIAEVHLNGEPILQCESMFVAHEIDVGERLRGENELAIRFRALTPLLAPRRKPRARWRTKVVSDGNLRFFRTSVFGRAPGFSPGPAPIGPWRAITIERRQGTVADQLRVRTRLDGDDGILTVGVRLRGLDGHPPANAEIQLSGPSGEQRCPLTPSGQEGFFEGELRVCDVARWWPHTHGEPALHDVRLLIEDSEVIDAGRVGFRDLAAGSAPGHDALEDGLALHVNDTTIFARGALWTPVDPLGLASGATELRTALEAVRDGGMNMLRIPGTGVYESDDFHDLCDELGILVWQDFMFANLDYPIEDESFRSQVELEAGQLLERLAWRPSLAVLCGNSEVEQQVAMLGLDPALGRGELFGELLPQLARESGSDAIYVPSSPSGGALPFRFDRGVSNYFGVGGYRRPLEDARRVEVRFASECLAIANVPDHDPAPKEGVPRDVGSEWDFEDVRDHYLHLLFGLDPAELRDADPGRYLELSRAVSGEVMAEVFGEWRRQASTCGGGLVLWMRDLVPGSGWGLVDCEGIPKVAYHHLRRALAPVAVWTTDEGLAGVAIHVANDRPEPLAARLRVGLYRELEHQVDEVSEEIVVPAHGGLTRDVEGMLGRFVDASYAYRFGEPQHDLIVATLERVDGDSAPISQAVRFPAGRPVGTQDPATLGLEAFANVDGDDILLTVRSRRLAYGVRVHAPGFDSDNDAFSVEPGGHVVVRLHACEAGADRAPLSLSALNLEGSVRVDIDESAG